MRHRVWTAVLLTLAAPAAAQPAATAQQRYAAAQAAFDAGRWREAYDGFTGVLPRLRGANAAMVGARAGAAAIMLGRPDDALPLLDAAMPQLAGEDRVTALMDQGRRASRPSTSSARARPMIRRWWRWASRRPTPSARRPRARRSSSIRRRRSARSTR